MVVAPESPLQSNGATTYLNAVAGLAVVLLVLLLFLNRKWCYNFVFEKNYYNDVLTVNTGSNNVQFDGNRLHQLHFPEKVFSFEASDSDDELRLQIQQDMEDIECGYQENNMNLIQSTYIENSVEANLLGSTLRETRIDEAEIQTHPVPCIPNVELDTKIENIGYEESTHHVEETTFRGDVNAPNCGSLEMTFLYDAPVRSMTVHVLQARDLPNKTRSQPLQSQVRVLLLPLKKQKFKTKIRSSENPQYMESFLFHKINPEDVHGLSLRIRIYGCERMRRQRLIGEAIITFASLNLEVENNLWVLLMPRSSAQQALAGMNSMGSRGSACELVSLGRSDSASSCCSARLAPELLLGLSYNSVTGRLSVEVIKGSHFRKLSLNKAPDTYVKLCMVSSFGHEMARSKTTTRRGQPNPLFKELFIFQVALFQLSEVTLMVSVWWRRSVKKNEMVGWFSLGLNSSGREEARHWREVCEARGDPVQRWHILIDS